MPAMMRIWLVSAVQLLGQRGLLDGRGLEHAADVADLGRHAGGHDQDGAGAARHLAVHEGHVDAVPEGRVGRDRFHLLGRRDALAGERGLVDLERGRGEDARVGRDQVAGLDVDDVARDQLLHRDLDQLAVAPDLGLDDHHALERVCAGLGLALLVHRHPGVEERQQDEEDARVELAGQEQADDARDQQHDLHRVRVLAGEDLQARCLLGLVERVGPVLGTTGVGLRRREAGDWIDIQAARHLVRCERVPIHRLPRQLGRSRWRARYGHDGISMVDLPLPALLGDIVLAARPV